ncbi:MAG: hypothetical protein A3J97_14650 [Spirochaetes bacterium RIFOXYC1_FULL_54_7]|nr:MAG: hypothetical protein A3J97_14650 [Spirochaetes bacterium RIFOXYC1_FULL_54_7]
MNDQEQEAETLDILWKNWNLPVDEGARCHCFGNTSLYVSINTAGDGAVLAAMVRFPEVKPVVKKSNKTARKPSLPELPPIDDAAWTRAFVGKTQEYGLYPGYPPLPICVRLHESFSLPPGSDIMGWIFSHLEARILINGEDMASFALIPPYKTLYGTPDSGVVCRYDEAEFLASEEPATLFSHANPALVAHPVRIRNSSSGPVKVSDLCIYGEQLSIFGTGSRLQSERLLFTFSSSGVRMAIDSQGRVPRDATVLARPRVSGEERAFERSFELFKAMTRI